MLTRIDPLGSICKKIFYARCYHRPQPPKKPSKDPFKEKQESKNIDHPMKKYGEKYKDLHLLMERLERRQKKLLTEMDEADKMLLDILQKDKKAEVNEGNSTKKST